MYRRLKEHPSAPLPCVPTMFAAGETGGPITAHAVGVPAIKQAEVQALAQIAGQIVYDSTRYASLCCVPLRFNQAQGG